MGGRKARTSGAAKRRGGWRFLLPAFCALAVLAVGGAKGHAQSGNGAGASLGGLRDYSQRQDGSFPVDSGDAVESLNAERRLNALNEERQKSMASDASKLLQLVTELNEEIARSNGGELTPEQLRMVAEIEKLAHSVRDKMAMSLRGPQPPGMGLPGQPFPPTARH
jgi:hypothetical protein